MGGSQQLSVDDNEGIGVAIMEMCDLISQKNDANSYVYNNKPNSVFSHQFLSHWILKIFPNYRLVCAWRVRNFWIRVASHLDRIVLVANFCRRHHMIERESHENVRRKVIIIAIIC